MHLGRSRFMNGTTQMQRNPHPNWKPLFTLLSQTTSYQTLQSTTLAENCWLRDQEGGWTVKDSHQVLFFTLASGDQVIQNSSAALTVSVSQQGGEELDLDTDTDMDPVYPRFPAN